MRLKALILIPVIFFLSCQNTRHPSDTELRSENDSFPKESPDTSKIPVESAVSGRSILALTSNALQVVSPTSGSTHEIPLGMEMDKVLKVVSEVLGTEIPDPQVNSECGAGPMTMSVFKNGLVLVFQKVKDDQSRLEFVGWSLSRSSNKSKLTTMANIGIGSTRAELESVYAVEVHKTSLGVEFSTIGGGLYGIIDGPSESSKISFLWSGLSCNFR